MPKSIIFILAAALLAMPAHGADWRDSTAEMRPGGFVGVRLKLRAGSDGPAKPVAALAIAPTQSRILQDGRVNTRFGQGLELSLAPRSKPTLTLAGSRADVALGLHPRGKVDPTKKQQLSTGGWIAIGGLTVAAAVAAALWIDAVKDSGD